jgi:hypothetical protein
MRENTEAASIRSVEIAPLPSGKHLGIEDICLCERFLETVLQGLHRIGGAIRHRVPPEFVFRADTQTDRVDGDTSLPGVGNGLR